jgi:hypothetical protein
MFLLVVLLAGLNVFGVLAHAQTSEGTLTGAIVSPAQVAIPEARGTLRRAYTGVARSLTTGGRAYALSVMLALRADYRVSWLYDSG